MRELAERLAHEELGHAAKLRQARRAAYRVGGHRSGGYRWDLPRGEIEDLRGLRTAAASLEVGVALRHEVLAANLYRSSTADSAAVAAVAQESRDAASILDLAGWTAEPAKRTADLQLPAFAPAALRDMLLDLEEAYSFYAGLAEVGPDETIVEEAQRQAHEAVRRLARVREALSQGHTLPWH